MDSAKNYIFIATISLCALIAAAFAYWSMFINVGVTPDSVVYLEAAESILAGNGVVVDDKPMTHYPPGYPLLIAAIAFFSSDTLVGARQLNLLLFAYSTLLIGGISYLATSRSILAGASASLFFLCAPAVFNVHMLALSEAPYILASLISVFLLLMYLRHSSNWILVGLTFALALALSLRYVGVTLLPPICIALLLFSKQPFAKRVIDCFVTSLGALLPLVCWFIRNRVLTDSATNRPISFHPIEIDRFRAGLESIVGFWVPVRIDLYSQVMLFTFLLIIMLFGAESSLRAYFRDKSIDNLGPAATIVSMIFIITYSVFLLFSISFIDAYTPLDARIMLPLNIFCIIALLTISKRTISASNKNVVWSVTIAILLILACWNGKDTYARGNMLHNHGAGFTHRYWGSSDSLHYAKNASESYLLYSNAPDLVKFQTGRKLNFLPIHTNPLSGKVNPSFLEELSHMYTSVEEGRALIIYFNPMAWRWYLPSSDELENKYHFPVFQILQDGIVFGKQ